MENSQNKKEIKINFWSYVAAIIITIIIFGGVIWWFNNDNKSVQNKTHISYITRVLNEKGSTYTDKYTFTEEDIKVDTIVESEYKPIYKVTINNGDILYVGFLIPNGKNHSYDAYSIGYTLEQVQNSLNQ